jgi:hypothetical protein
VQKANSDIQAEGTQIRTTTSAFNRLMDCREAEANRIRTEFAAARIDRATAEEQMGALEQKLNADLERARDIGVDVDKRSGAFVDVYNGIAAENDAQQIEISAESGGERVEFVAPSPARGVETTPTVKLPPAAKDEVAKMGQSTKDTIEARGDMNEAIRGAEAKKQSMTKLPS